MHLRMCKKIVKETKIAILIEFEIWFSDSCASVPLCCKCFQLANYNELISIHFVVPFREYFGIFVVGSLVHSLLHPFYFSVNMIEDDFFTNLSSFMCFRST
jgi:hypothetical protein